MQPTNKAISSAISRCIYCGSTTRGKGCKYGPYGVHFHPDNVKKCAYCGSTNYGRGCKTNPTSDLHIHGINYNSMFKEQIESFLEYKIFIENLKKPFVEFKAYKLKLIDENGNKIKTPATDLEKFAYSPFVRTIIKIKKYLGSKLDLIEAENNLVTETLQMEDLSKYKKLLEYKDEVGRVINSLYDVIERANDDGFSLDEINQLLKA